MIWMRSVSFASCLAVVLLPELVMAQSVPFPSDPIAPTSQAECSQLTASYNGILGEISQRQSDLPPAPESWTYQEHWDAWKALQRDWDMVAQAKSTASSRCYAQLEAYLRNARATEREAQEAAQAIPRGASTDLAGSNAWLAGGQVERRTSGTGIVSQMEGVAALGGAIQRAAGGDPVGGGAALGTSLAGYAGVFDRFREFMVGTSLDAAIAVQQGAVRDLESAMRHFDAASEGTINQVSAALMRQGGEVRYLLSGEEVAVPATDALASELRQALASLEAYRAARGQESTEAMQRVAEARAAQARENARIVARHAEMLALEQQQQWAYENAQAQASQLATGAQEAQRIQDEQMLGLFIGVVGAIAGGGGAGGYAGGGGSGDGGGAATESYCLPGQSADRCAHN